MTDHKPMNHPCGDPSCTVCNTPHVSSGETWEEKFDKRLCELEQIAKENPSDGITLLLPILREDHKKIKAFIETEIATTLTTHRDEIVRRLDQKQILTKSQIKLLPWEMDRVEEAIHERDAAYLLMLWQHTLTDHYNKACKDAIAIVNDVYKGKIEV